MTGHLARIEQYVDKVEDWDQLPDIPLVSVCITTYDHEDFIADAIEGALMQETDFPYEIIIAEDNSTDGTREIVRNYQQRYSGAIRLRLARENLYSKNRRYPRFGTRAASRGEYIALCEGDDYWTDAQKLQKQVDLLEARSDFAFCFTASTFSYEDEGHDDKIVRPKGEQNIYHLRDIISKNFISTCTVTYKKDILRKVPDYFWKTPVGDWPLFVALAQRGYIGYIDDVTAVRRVHQSGVWSKMSFRKKLRSWIRTRELAYESLSKKHKKICNDFLLSKKSKLMYQLYKIGSYREACRLSRECLNHMCKSKQNKYDIGGYIKYSICTVTNGLKLWNKIGKYWRRISRGVKRRLSLSLE